MPDPSVDANQVIAYLKAQIAELSGELAFSRALLDARTEERDAALRALQAQETPKEGKPGLKVAGKQP